MIIWGKYPRFVWLGWRVILRCTLFICLHQCNDNVITKLILMLLLLWSIIPLKPISFILSSYLLVLMNSPKMLLLFYYMFMHYLNSNLLQGADIISLIFNYFFSCLITLDIIPVIRILSIILQIFSMWTYILYDLCWLLGSFLIESTVFSICAH